MKKDVGQLVLKRLSVLAAGEVTALNPPAGDRPRHAREHLLDRALTLGRTHLPAEVLLGDDVGRVLRPRLRELDVGLLERDLAAVADARVAQLPLDRREGILPSLGEIPLDREALPCCCYP